MKIMLIELVDARGVTIDSCSVKVADDADPEPLVAAAKADLAGGLLRNTGSTIRVSEYRG